VAQARKPSAEAAIRLLDPFMNPQLPMVPLMPGYAKPFGSARAAAPAPDNGLGRRGSRT
jgi:hypothetical protein